MLRHVWHRLWRVALGLGAVLLTSLAAIWAATQHKENSCEHAIVARLPSPDGAWEARVEVTACLFGFGVGAVVAEAQIVSTRDPARFADLLGVDTGGHEDERLRLAWTAPDVLQITVYDHSYLKVLTRGFGGVRVDLRYDPDDPADRAAWRREHGMPADPE